MAKGVRQPVKYYPFHESGMVRAATFASIDNALNDDKGALALFRRKLNSDKALFVVIWNSDDTNDALIVTYSFTENTLIKVGYSRGKAERFIEEFRRYECNPENLEKVRPLLDEISSHIKIDTPCLTATNYISPPSSDDSLARDVLDICNLSLPDLPEMAYPNADIDESAENIAPSTREQLILARVGQGKFRKAVIQLWGKKCCAVTSINIPELLIASHIKAWSKCDSTEERLDGANGILLSAHVDKLFDHHLITFIPDQSKRYILQISKNLVNYQSELGKLDVHQGMELKTTSLDFATGQRFEEYMQHHNEAFLSRENEAT